MLSLLPQPLNKGNGKSIIPFSMIPSTKKSTLTSQYYRDVEDITPDLPSIMCGSIGRATGCLLLLPFPAAAIPDTNRANTAHAHVDSFYQQIPFRPSVARHKLVTNSFHAHKHRQRQRKKKKKT